MKSLKTIAKNDTSRELTKVDGTLKNNVKDIIANFSEHKVQGEKNTVSRMRIYPKKMKRNGRRFSFSDKTQLTVKLLNAAGVKYISGNSAARNSATGDYIEISVSDASALNSMTE